MSGKTEAVTPVATEQQAAATQQTVAAPRNTIAPLTGTTDEDTVVKISGIKKAMVKTMTESLTIPFFTFSDEMDATSLIHLRKDFK